jgi:hypothetical protein
MSFDDLSNAIIGGIPGEGLATAGAVQAQTVMQKIEFAITRLEIVKQAKIMYDNYVQTKQYYEMIKEASKHRGGLLGYYQDRFMSRLTDAAYERWANIQNMQYGSDDNMVRRLVEGGEKFVESKMDKTVDQWIDNMEKELNKAVQYINEETEGVKKRSDQLQRLVNDASKTNLTDREKDSFQLQAQMLQLEYLASIDKANKVLFVEQTKQMQREWQMMKRNQIASSSLIKSMQKGMANQHRGLAPSGKLTEGQAIRILGDTPR